MWRPDLSRDLRAGFGGKLVTRSPPRAPEMPLQTPSSRETPGGASAPSLRVPPRRGVERGHSPAKLLQPLSPRVLQRLLSAPHPPGEQHPVPAGMEKPDPHLCSEHRALARSFAVSDRNISNMPRLRFQRALGAARACSAGSYKCFRYLNLFSATKPIFRY